MQSPHSKDGIMVFDDIDASVVDWSDSTSVFNLFDLDNSGYIDSVEVRGALTCALDKLVTDDECAKLFKEFDADQNGLLDMDEFKTMVDALKKRRGRLGHRLKRVGINKNANAMAVREAKETAIEGAFNAEEKPNSPNSPNSTSTTSTAPASDSHDSQPKRSAATPSSSLLAPSSFSSPSSPPTVTGVTDDVRTPLVTADYGSCTAPNPDSLEFFADMLPDGGVKEEVKKLVKTFTTAESKTLLALAMNLSSSYPPSSSSSSSSSVTPPPSPPTNAQVALVVHVVKHRLTPSLRSKIDEALSAQSVEGSSETRNHASFALQFFSAVDEASIKAVLGTALSAYAVYSRTRALEKRPSAHDFAHLIEYGTVYAAVNVVRSLPLPLLDSLFARLDRNAGEPAGSPSGLLSQAAKIGRAILSQPADVLARILTPALETAAVVAELSELAAVKQEEERDEETGLRRTLLRKTLDQNAFMEDILQKTSKKVATVHLELMALPRDLKASILAALPEDARKACAPVLELTEGMLERDVEELFIAMAREAFPQAEKPPSSPVAVALRLDGDFHATVGTEENRRDFERKFTADVAEALGVHPSRVRISGLEAGSIVVKFEIAGNGEDGHAGEDRTASDLAEALKAQVADRSSAIYRGALTGAVSEESLVIKVLPVPVPTAADLKAAEQKKWNKMKDKSLSIARVVARTESRRLANWVYNSPTSLRALTFLCGFSLLVSSIFSLVTDLFSGEFSAFLISFWLMLLSLLLVVSEAKIQALQSYVVVHVENYFQLMSYVSGRGYYLIFLGVLACSLITKGAWQNSLDLAVGALCIAVGTITVVQGTLSANKSNNLRASLDSEANVRAKFSESDVNGDGSLDGEELGGLCQRLGSHMDVQQLECALRSLDENHDGTVDVEEFVKWWRAGDDVEPVEPAAAAAAEGDGDRDLEAAGGDLPEGEDCKSDAQKVKEKGKERRSAPTFLRTANLLVAACVIMSGVVGTLTIWTKHPSSFLVSIMDVWMIAFGVLMLFFETGAWCACAAATTGRGKVNVGASAAGRFNTIARGAASRSAGLKTRLVNKYLKFLDTVVGRGVFFFFVSALCIASYEPGIGPSGLLGVFTGLAVAAAAVINVAVGLAASAEFKKLRDKVAGDRLEETFKRADTDGGGDLDLGELAVFCKGLGIRLNHRQWEILVQDMDKDGSGTVDFEEFKQWWGRADL